MSFLTKMLFKESINWAFSVQNVDPDFVKKVVFIPATLLLTQFSLKTKFLIAIASS